MFRRPKYLIVMAVVAVGTPLLLTPAEALAGRVRRPELHRVIWQYQGGFFRDDGNKRWDEANSSGSYHFREVRRNPQFIDLFDASRDFTVRLYNDESYLRGGKDQPAFTKLYDGGWTE